MSQAILENYKAHLLGIISTKSPMERAVLLLWTSVLLALVAPQIYFLPGSPSIRNKWFDSC